MTFQKLSLASGAGRSIVVRVFALGDEAAKGVCIIAPATGVAQYLYDDFATWLTEQGYHVVTFDYHGMGLSINGHVKHCKGDILNWANDDCPAVLDYVEQEFPGLERIWIGHSVGGHMLGMMPNTDKVDRAITVAAGTGTWWYNAMPTRRVVWFLWFVLVPILVPMLGYYPGNRLRLLCDMPKDVIMQWRRWCMFKYYAVGCEGDWLRDRFANVRIPLTAIAFSDDDMMSMKSVDMLHAFFTNAPIKRITVTPEEANQKRIGHIGWHRKRYTSLWDRVFLPILQGK